MIDVRVLGSVEKVKHDFAFYRFQSTNLEEVRAGSLFIWVECLPHNNYEIPIRAIVQLNHRNGSLS
jgi:hypothetical protein